MQELMDRCLAARVMVCPGRLFILNPTREYSEKGTLPIEEVSIVFFSSCVALSLMTGAL